MSSWKGPLSLVKKVHRALKGVPWAKRALYALEGGVLRVLEGAVGFRTPPRTTPPSASPCSSDALNRKPWPTCARS
jgi:hypothetical protein